MVTVAVGRGVVVWLAGADPPEELLLQPATPTTSAAVPTTTATARLLTPRTLLSRSEKPS
jgi:hypothetical protein